MYYRSVVEVRSAQVYVRVLKQYSTIPTGGHLRTMYSSTADALQRYGRCRSSQSACFVLKIGIALFLRIANQITLGHVGPWYENYFLRVLKAPPVSHDCLSNWQ